MRPKLLDRLKVILRRLSTLLYNTGIELNIFPLRTFGSSDNRMTAKRLGQFATRLYIALLTISLTIIILYTVVRPQLLTKAFDSPSFDVYNRLQLDHGPTLRCPCSFISSQYGRYVQIKPILHQVRLWRRSNWFNIDGQVTSMENVATGVFILY